MNSRNRGGPRLHNSSEGYKLGAILKKDSILARKRGQSEGKFLTARQFLPSVKAEIEMGTYKTASARSDKLLIKHIQSFITISIQRGERVWMTDPTFKPGGGRQQGYRYIG